MSKMPRLRGPNLEFRETLKRSRRIDVEATESVISKSIR